MFKRLSETLGAYQARDPAARSKLEILLLYPGVHAILFHRVSHWLYRHRLFFLARLNSQLARHLTGIEIHPGAQIGRRFVIDHGMGIVIGETTEIGDDCLIYHGVTLGGTGKDHGKRHPTLGNNVMVSAGAKVLGPFKVGDGARIAANAVVLTEIPPEATAVGVPARVVRIAGEKVDFASSVDQIHVTDPVQKELQAISSRLEWLENYIDEQHRMENR
ncbi:serine O-acetyltransferase EpsC [Intestinimonas sp.]|uniref:serine O-acetyltransferase EpsC n=1 Tax=Intestinimonas sp. TaxID=1965293 RepID=UPI0026123A84|nr:serine O-acetyltransferase EpsC [Intestinimonas sp.]